MLAAKLALARQRNRSTYSNIFQTMLLKTIHHRRYDANDTVVGKTFRKKGKTTKLGYEKNYNGIFYTGPI